jgi:hypothetical protein
MFGQSYINSYEPSRNSFNSFTRLNTADNNYHYFNNNNSDIFRNTGNYVIPTQTNNYQYSANRGNSFYPSSAHRSGSASFEKFNKSSFVVNEAQYQYKPEESKNLRDNRYSSFRNNLNPKIGGNSNKNNLISEYDSEYVPYSPEFYVPIYTKNKGLKRLENHDSIFRKETKQKKKYDKYGNYKLPYNLKKQLEALENMDEYLSNISRANTNTEISKEDDVPIITTKVPKKIVKTEPQLSNKITTFKPNTRPEPQKNTEPEIKPQTRTIVITDPTVDGDEPKKPLKEVPKKNSKKRI